ncbi:uncharacterized protein LOC116337709 [Contarinia nasturtii]|uniref:uncharacterized protein LOC116337709 n=1 Tax=Contarinia nasturtii TaxID=265458 RepID=UPI0012D40109|nr:uncharacterized protein LOC116337709 [Contarinia nasturtii]
MKFFVALFCVIALTLIGLGEAVRTNEQREAANIAEFTGYMNEFLGGMAQIRGLEPIFQAINNNIANAQLQTKPFSDVMKLYLKILKVHEAFTDYRTKAASIQKKNKNKVLDPQVSNPYAAEYEKVLKKTRKYLEDTITPLNI